ncbi:GIY-YIG nuclease family protein [Glaciecola sp. 2405UD65-10]|uniref:GIY-YIG nuclease family protein n=1 Tax=Glaciecola sp. 2405UD65-10 TaxID=3397244 RepID=UPI003B5BF573
MVDLDKLLTIGFKKVGQWSILENKLSLNIFAEETSRNVLYSFVVDNQPKYIGKTTQQLKRRMYGYQNPGPSQTTNIRNNAEIKLALESSKIVELYVLPDNGLLHLGEFHVNLAAGLEDSITKTLKPEWNMQGKL